MTATALATKDTKNGNGARMVNDHDHGQDTKRLTKDTKSGAVLLRPCRPNPKSIPPVKRPTARRPSPDAYVFSVDENGSLCCEISDVLAGLGPLS